MERSFPDGFLWGAATAGHQVEGNNVNSDMWVAENVTPTVFVEPSGDAANSFELWSLDLDLVRDLGFNAYRFGIEWSRIEPEPGRFSIAMLDHYKAMIEGCAERGIAPMVTFSHFSTPRWFASRGGWLERDAPEFFARFCERAARHLESGMAYAVTLNEPNVFREPRKEDGKVARIRELFGAMNAAAAKAVGSEKFSVGTFGIEDLDLLTRNQITAHNVGKAAIKAARSTLPVGVTLAMPDDQPVGESSMRDAFREATYVPWLESARSDDFLGVQNYDRQLWDSEGKVAPPEGDLRASGETLDYNASGGIVYPDSLANAVRYAHSIARVPIIVTEHGVNAHDDTVRANMIPAALVELRRAMDEGIPVEGYLHWSLLDNFEWIFGYQHQYGLVAVDRTSFARTPKPSAYVLGSIAQSNALPAARTSTTARTAEGTSL
jgi:beta-glucosidase